jgi:arylsulfatase A-like enzyme
MLSFVLLVTARAAKPKNVLFLVADDLRPQLNKAYGKTFMKTPNIDKFTDTALVFDWAYTNFAICSASRNSFMTGRVPDKTRTWNFIDDFRETGPDWVTLPEFFKNHNYTTIGHGKLYHPGHPANNDLPYSWDAYPSGTTNSGCQKQHGGGNFCPDGDSAPNQFSDVNVTNIAIETIKTVAAKSKVSGQPWFIGMGWHYPHQPWHVPLSITASYPNAITGLPAPTHPFSPKNVPDVAFTAEMDGQPSMSLNEDLPGFHSSRPAGIEGLQRFLQPRPGNNTFPSWFTQQIRLGYYSAVTHMDIHFGQILDTLEATGLADDTIVIMTGDHGWQLGEHTEYGKHTNFELGTHVPLLIRDPSKKSTSAGKHASNTKAELVDLYRTLVSLAGLPSSEIEDNVDGVDLSPVLDDPTLNVRNYSFSQYSRCPGDRDWKKPVKNVPDWYMNNCEQVPAKNISFMGYTVRSSSYRYTMWFQFNGSKCEAMWDSPLEGEELYSHVGHDDPGNFDDYENDNIVSNPNMKNVVAEHRRILLANFQGADKRVAGCPVKKPPSPTPSPSPLPDNALVLLRSSVGHDSELCGFEACVQDKGKKWNYLRIGIEGYAPSSAQAIGVDRVPLYLYWNPTAHDNFVTTELQKNQVPQGYKSTGQILGWVLSAPTHGAVPVMSWYNAKKMDHLTGASETTIAYAKANDYELLQSEPIGYLFAQPEWSESSY